MSSLPQAKIAELATNWAARLAAETKRFPASDIYGGRAFQVAAVAADLLDARLMVVSAGLGLICASDCVPPYACTVLVDAPDSVGARVEGEFTIAGWWKVLSQASPFGTSLCKAAGVHSGLICAALSDSYIEMVSADLAGLPHSDRVRLRLFTRAPLSRVAPELRSFVMPYDDRLDGPDSPIRGTRNDFAARAVHHFAQFIANAEDPRSPVDHAEAVTATIAGWRMPERFERARHDDAALLDLIRAHWDAEGGSASRLLRRFRDDLKIGCEQRRFAALARQVRAEQA